MWILLRSMSTAGTKIIATFFMVLVLIAFSILFFPQGFNAINDLANYIANLDMIRNPTVDEQRKALVRLFINEASIFGILITLIARMFVEIIFFGAIGLWRLANPSEKPAGDGVSARDYYNER